MVSRGDVRSTCRERRLELFTFPLGGHGASMCDIAQVGLIVFVSEVAESTSNFAPAPAPSGFQWKSARVAPNVVPKRGSGGGVETRERFESEANAPTGFTLSVLAPGQVRG